MEPLMDYIKYVSSLHHKTWAGLNNNKLIHEISHYRRNHLMIRWSPSSCLPLILEALAGPHASQSQHICPESGDHAKWTIHDFA
ncbi:hypothetical protein PGT21_021726 [Puccinia graminis f. sp. tritici]|uniref:Uncharacterized protein n=1 Tax=Puccinia graminis f. sp. tritici TaxID=56615 RepID=A0A5B0S417_PUCGR|nr:hypothetical protein PGT21_021726 [Puccinia graminis f. sp. tritici]KAA1131843.1 hypothetical protein PGTUg99_030090 [Puccinia graminis f. sp. tritici]